MLKIPERLDSDRIFLRPHQEEDLECFIEFMSNQEATSFMKFTDEQKTQEGATEMFLSVIKSYSCENPILSLSIILKMSEEYIGSCGLSPIEGGQEMVCYYTLLPEYWGNGYAIEAMKTLFKYAFESLKVERIIAHINPYNKRSWKVAERAGMMYMGQYLDEETNSKAMHYKINKKDFMNLVNY